MKEFKISVPAPMFPLSGGVPGGDRNSCDISVNPATGYAIAGTSAARGAWACGASGDGPAKPSFEVVHEILGSERAGGVFRFAQLEKAVRIPFAGRERLCKIADTFVRGLDAHKSVVFALQRAIRVICESAIRGLRGCVPIVHEFVPNLRDLTGCDKPRELRIRSPESKDGAGPQTGQASG